MHDLESKHNSFFQNYKKWLLRRIAKMSSCIFWDLHKTANCERLIQYRMYGSTITFQLYYSSIIQVYKNPESLIYSSMLDCFQNLKFIHSQGHSAIIVKCINEEQYNFYHITSCNYTLHSNYILSLLMSIWMKLEVLSELYGLWFCKVETCHLAIFALLRHSFPLKEWVDDPVGMNYWIWVGVRVFSQDQLFGMWDNVGHSLIKLRSECSSHFWGTPQHLREALIPCHQPQIDCYPREDLSPFRMQYVFHANKSLLCLQLEEFIMDCFEKRSQSILNVGIWILLIFVVLKQTKS